jgi:exodeoxyribonuclease V alpha subunit
MRPERLLKTLDQWVEAGALRALDRALACFLAEQSGERDPAVLLAVALTSERHGHGHVCLDLAAALEQPETLLSRLRDDQEVSAEVRQALSAELRLLDLADWVARLAASPLVAERAMADERVSPLVLAGLHERPSLYLRRYWQYEQRIRIEVEARLARGFTVDPALLREQLDALFARAPAKPSASVSVPTTDARARSQTGPQLSLDLTPESESEPEPEPEPEPDWQRIACALAVRHAFFIITGGPGTGKTTTVVRLLAVLQALASATGERPLRIALAAPTGKAAARLNESISEQVCGLPAELLTEGRIPTQVKTLHRLLGTRPDSRHFRHDLANPLPADVVVVDEASMVDVELMASLLEAMRPDARLILIGDKDQLSSVEAGAVLGDLCQRAAAGHYLPATLDWLERASGERVPTAYADPDGRPLDQAIAMLRKSYRFSERGGIGALAALVNRPPQADGAQQRRRLKDLQQLFEQERRPAHGDLGAIDAIAVADPEASELEALVRAGYGGSSGYLRLMRTQAPSERADQAELDAWAKRMLAAQKRFQLLTPLRQGDWGVEGLNRRIIASLRAGGELDLGEWLVGASDRHWFPGRPVLMTRNDYSLNLMNGDIGVTLAVPVLAKGQVELDPGEASGSGSGSGSGAVSAPTPTAVRWMLRVAFPRADGGVRWVLPSRLQAVETVFAMTVHKSQGSEFLHTALVLPNQASPVLTRELLYTAITRAKRRFTLVYADLEALELALERQVQRVSGLRDLG